MVAGGPDLTCVASTWASLQSAGLNTTFLISVGGWGAPHPAVTNDPAAVYASWKAWNAAAAQGAWPGFDGIDWDMEGANDVSSPTNHFTVRSPHGGRGITRVHVSQAACLDTVGKFSIAAKADGFIVTIVPPESYYDITTSVFDLSLLHAYPEGPASFQYHGHSAYAYLQSRYGGGVASPTFDIVMIQVRASVPDGCALSDLWIRSFSCMRPTVTRTSTSRRSGSHPLLIWRHTSRACMMAGLSNFLPAKMWRGSRWWFRRLVAKS